MNVTPIVATQAAHTKKDFLHGGSSGVVKAPLRILIYGPEGIGKSSFAAGSPKPFWIGAEKGTEHLDVKRAAQPESYGEIREAIAQLTTGDHPYETLVMDPLGWMQPFIFAEVCRRTGTVSGNIEDVGGGFQKGYEAAIVEWRQIIADVERMADKRKMNVIFVAHSTTKKQKSPDSEDFDRYVLELHPFAAAVFRQWVDYVLFARRDVWTEATAQNKKRFRGISSGERFLHTQWAPAFDAKSRPQLPDPIPFREKDAWATFMRAREFVTNQIGAKQADLDALLLKADAATVAQVRAFIAEDPKDVTRYDEAINQLKEIIK